MHTDEIRQLVASGDLEKALEHLLALTEGTARHALAVQLAARFNTLKNNELKGIVSFENARLERNQITHDLLELLEGRPVPGVTKRNWGWKKIAAAVGSFIVFGAAVAEFSGYSLRDIFQKKNDSAPLTQPTLDTTRVFQPAESPPAVQRSSTLQPTGGTASSHPAQPPASGKADTVLTIACRTDKGNQNLLYRDGETMRLFVQVNQPCHLRTIYRLADGQLTLLDNDRQLSAGETGRFFEIGAGFTCSAPFGQETLYVFAQSGPFPPLRTELLDGYEIVRDGLPDALRKTRGFKKKYRYAEASLSITTAEK